jgi:uncharacterized protein YmfQ (DUF2313 family)
MSKAEELKAHAPESISQVTEFRELYNTQGAALDDLYEAVEDILNQCFVRSATWGLRFWERVLGIPTDESKEASFRRDVILSKIKGVGTVTVALLDNVAESYDNGEIQVRENNELYRFEVEFVGTKGIPPNLTDLQNAINQLKPAHLDVVYTFRYNTYQYLSQYTHAQLGNYTHQNLREVI